MLAPTLGDTEAHLGEGRGEGTSSWYVCCPRCLKKRGPEAQVYIDHGWLLTISSGVRELEGQGRGSEGWEAWGGTTQSGTASASQVPSEGR